MLDLRWEEINPLFFGLYNFDKLVGSVSFNSSENEMFTRYWSGSFITSDGGMIGLNPISQDLNESKQRIKDNYLANKDYEWWMR